MAEIRKHNPTTSDIGAQVRALMGETIRPRTPGQPNETPEPDDAMYDPFSGATPKDETTNIVPFRAGDDPLIGVLPSDFQPWSFDDDDDPAA
jgi:hypothetical protein